MKTFFKLFLCLSSLLLLCNCNNKNDIKLSGNDEILTEVDLGLSVKWANMNLGAERPEDFGKYYALGHVQPYDTIPVYDFDLPDSPEKWLVEHTWLGFGGDWSDPSNEIGRPHYCGIVLPKYDAASYQTDNRWRIPTPEEWMELGQKCKWIWGSYKSVQGFYIKGPNGNSIFLPAAGEAESKYGDKLKGAYRSSFVWDGGATWGVYFYEPKNTNNPTIALDNPEHFGDVHFESWGCQVPISIRPVKVKE